MTEGNQATDISTWWDQKEFDSKDIFELNNDGDIVLKEYPGFGQRSVGNVTTENADIVYNLLIEKFPEVKSKVEELSAEWLQQDDKLSLIGKLERTKEYLLHANALGDLHELFKVVTNLDTEAKKLIEENYKKKLEIVEKAEGLADSEDWKSAADTLKGITDEWKEAGYLDKDRNDALWARIEAARDKFFERKREHQEDLNKEMLQNLDLKMEVVDNAEKLAASDDWKGSTEAFKELMEKWKAIGHTMHDKNEELWNRFIAAKNAFFDKKKEHFEEIKKEQEVNLAAKEELVNKAVEMQESTNWGETTKAYAALMEEWKKIGRVPREKSDDIWARFNAARDHFFGKKREHVESFKIELDDNYAQKLALLKRAEELEGSSQWREATQELNELMEEWKKIGPVPRKHSDEIWERFIKARKNFFKRKDENREKRKKHFERKSKERLGQTENFITKLEAELEEEEEKLKDFKEAIENITPGKKEKELRAHLTKLIAQTEKKIEHKREKMVEVTQQFDEMKAKEETKTEKKEAPAEKGKSKEEPEKQEESKDEQ